jgi:hypothetical protein
VKQKEDSSSSSSEDESVKLEIERAPIPPVILKKRGREFVDDSDFVQDDKKNIDTEQQLKEMRIMLMESQQMVKMLSSKIEEQALAPKEKMNLIDTASDEKIPEVIDEKTKLMLSLMTQQQCTNYTTVKELVHHNSSSLSRDHASQGTPVAVPDTMISRTNRGFYNFIFQSGMNLSKTHLLEDQLEQYKRMEREANRQSQLQNLLDSFH